MDLCLLIIVLRPAVFDILTHVLEILDLELEFPGFKRNGSRRLGDRIKVSLPPRQTGKGESS